jgi:hypothetical protein
LLVLHGLVQVALHVDHHEDGIFDGKQSHGVSFLASR